MLSTYVYGFLVASALVAQSAAQGEWNPDDVAAQNEAGASGKSGGGGMSTGGMIALCVIVGVVVILGFGSAALFFVAKKRQWAMREAIRRSAKQVVKAVKTPLTPRFPRSQRPPFADEDQNKNFKKSQKPKPRTRPTDVEKNVIIEMDESSKSSETKARGWSSYFSLNRS